MQFQQNKEFPLLIVITALVVVFFITAFFILPRVAPVPNEEQAAATVNGEKILKKDFDRRVEVMTYFYTTVSPWPERLENIKEEQLEFLIKLKLLEQFLRQHNREVTQEELDTYTKNWAERYGGLEAYDAWLKAGYHSSVKDVQLTFKENLLIEEILGFPGKKHMYGIWLNRTSPSDVALGVGSGYQVLEGQVPEEDKPIWEKAKLIYERATSGEDFQALAREFSEDPETRANGGDLGVISSFDQNFTRVEEGAGPYVMRFPPSAIVSYAWEQLGEGETELYGYPSGFAIMRVSEVADAEESLISTYSRQGFEEWYRALREQADVEIHNIIR